jgi:5-methylcytosine-specific restriction endonuclease McrA
MEKITSPNHKKFRSWLMSGLRKISRFWEPARECLKKARIARGMYTCNMCKQIVGAKEIKIDHINPVIPIDGFKDWDDVVKRLFCEEDGFQAICKPCHDTKTKEENSKRKILKKEKAVIKYFKDKNKDGKLDL